jgi:hypothetical protein
MKFDFNELLASIKEAQQMQGVRMCECKCAEAKVKPKSQRYFDILCIPSGDYVSYDVPESKLSECIEYLLKEGRTIEDLRITQDIAVKQIWTVDE